jgi:hypothetical protein
MRKLALAIIMGATSLVGCTRTGVIEVTTAARGPKVDQLQLEIDIDSGSTRGPIAANNGSFIMRNVSRGDHVVRLTNVPPECDVISGTEISANISGRDTSRIMFTMHCR